MNFTVFLFLTAVSLIMLLYAQTSGRRTLFDPGVLIITLFAFCYLVPTVLVKLGFNIYVVTDDVGVIELLSLYGIIFVITFTFVYLRIGVLIDLRQNRNDSAFTVFRPTPAFVLLLISILIQKALVVGFGGGGASDYSEQYVLRSEMAIEASQFINLWGGIIFMNSIIFLISAIGPSKTALKYRVGLIILVFLVHIVDLLLTQARTNFVTFVVLTIGVFNFYHFPIGIIKEVIFSVLLIVLMSLFALFRSGFFDESIYLDLLTVLMPSEFLSIYNNALQLLMIVDSVDYVGPPGISYLQSLISFIPKQLNEDKWDLALWYVSEYFPYYMQSGGGLAFGIVPEAIVNFGLGSIIFQAFVVASILKISFSLGWRHRHLGANSSVVLYLFCFGGIYQMIRSHSFAIISSFILGFIIPYYLITWLLRYVHGNSAFLNPKGVSELQA